MKFKPYIGCCIILQAILVTQQHGFPEIEFGNTSENPLAWMDLEEKINHQFKAVGIVLSAAVILRNAKVILEYGAHRNLTEITRAVTEDMTTLSNRRSILDVALLADKSIIIPEVKNLPGILRKLRTNFAENALLENSKHLENALQDALTRLLNFYECQVHQIDMPDTALGLLFLKGIDDKHGKILQSRFPLGDWINGVCERSKTHHLAQGEFCYDLARQWKNRSGKKKTVNMDYWKNSSVIQFQLNRIDDKIFESVGREHEGMWGTLNGECQLALVSRCEIPYVCERTLLDPTPRSQYLLTHQVLQRVLVETVECPHSPTVNSFVTEDSIYTDLCAKMYMEAKYLDVLNLPIVHRDLFTEFVGFCGYLGYTNFFREDWLQAILSWQSKSDLGCFLKNVNSPVGIFTPDIPIKKLESCNKNGEIQDIESEEKCLPHFTAVGLIALSAHWDYLLDLNSNKYAK